MRMPRLPIASIILLCLVATGFLAGHRWLERHPQHNPWAPLDLRDPDGWATTRKLAVLKSDPAECRAVFERSQIRFTALPDAGEGQCRRRTRTLLTSAPLAPDSPPVSCPVAAGFQLWLQQSLQPAARSLLGSEIAKVEHLGAYSCRRIGAGEMGRWSEHATGNAIDIAAFVTTDGRRVSVLRDWDGQADRAAFLRRARDEACSKFGTVLSPDYNAAHRDHFHLDQASRGFGSFCR